MNELELVEKIRRLAARGKKDPRLVLGIGDDCAIYRPTAGRSKSNEDLLLKTDQFIEGVHFRPDLPASIAGERALGRSLSDIAAMGGSPGVCLVSLTVSRTRPDKWIDDFFRGLLSLARRTGTMLAGGDLAHSDKVYCAVMVCGTVARGKALRRDGARHGDGLYVSGRLGKSWERRIEPRLALGQTLLGDSGSPRATACIDISDGLALDLHRLCLASGFAAEIDRVPLARGATIERALHGGEDYELLFTLPADATPPKGTTRIGSMVPGRPGEVRLQGRPLEPRGYDHFGTR
jgi:thiamine-monophosphate kinase